MQFKYLLIVVSIFPGPLYAARILSIFGVPIASQYAFIEPLLKQLAARGHKITSINNFPQQEKVDNFRDVVIEKNKHLFDEYRNFSVENIDANYYDIVDKIYSQAFQMCINILSDPVVRHMLDNEKFDLIIIDIFLSESFYGFSEYLQAPMIGVSTYGAGISIDELVGNISPLSYVPEIILTMKVMSFNQRLLNVLIHFLDWMHYYYKYIPVQRQIYEFYFPNATLTFAQAQRNFSLVLVNDHFSLTQPRPYVPNMIEVAGLNIQTNPQPLTDDIKHLLDNAQQGVILIDLDLATDSNVLNIFLKQFNKMSQLIIWKTFQHIYHTPQNVYVKSSWNVQSIIAHPNIKLYITTGNFQSVVESVYYGIPIFGICSTEKETDYIDYVKKIGNGLSLKKHYTTERSLAKAISELLYNPYYASVAKTFSLRFRDQQNTPMERAIYWIEYVLRHDGAYHLKNRGQKLTWWQFYNIDVFAVILMLFILFIVSALFVVKLISDFFWNGRKLNNDKENKMR